MSQPPEGKPSLSTRLAFRVQLSLDGLRHQLAHLDALPLLTLLGFFSALAAAATITAFRYLIDLPAEPFLGIAPDRFEELEAWQRFLLPLSGAAVIATVISLFPAANRQTSVGHVVERLHNHQGNLPAANWLLQFIGGVIALISGQSVGREGPAVHLGAGAASQLGQWLKLPNNSLRTLIACGVASAIAASFNTPMAGVIFAMEVILMEYTIAGFIPVILASVTGATISQVIFGPEPAFTLPPLQLNTLWELPWIAFCGIIIGLFSALFIQLQLWFNRRKGWPIQARITLAGAITGAVALYVPEIMGLGYDTIEASLNGSLPLQLLLTILIAKIVITTLSTGLGMPGGIIGPILFIGAVLGGALGIISEALSPTDTANATFYVVLGMGGAMAAIINAPLTALITVLELTYNPHIIFPCMLIIVASVLSTRQLFKCEGVFLSLLKDSGFHLNNGPIRQALTKVGVRSAIDTNFVSCKHRVTYPQIQQILAGRPNWIVVDELDRDKILLNAADIAAYLIANEASEAESINLLELPGESRRLQPIHQQASLFEAKQAIDAQQVDAFYVERRISPLLSPVLGILTAEQINNYYQ